MPRYSNPEIISAIHNGNEEVLFYVSRKFFQPARRWLRRKGVPDEKTPEIFISILLKVFREIQQQRLSVHIDFESFLFNSLDDHFRQEKTKGRDERFKTESSFSDENKEIVAQCVSILDEENRKLLFSRYAEKLSFEQIAVRFNYSNPVIAQFEVNKAMNRLEAISRIQLNIESN
jgi:DNA-directed RNA polymerase specialized sigma24 family protein